MAYFFNTLNPLQGRGFYFAFFENRRASGSFYRAEGDAEAAMAPNQEEVGRMFFVIGMVALVCVVASIFLVASSDPEAVDAEA